MAKINWNDGRLINLNPGDTATCTSLFQGQLFGLIFFNSADNQTDIKVMVNWSNSQPPVFVNVPKGLAAVLFVNGSDTNTISVTIPQDQPASTIQCYIASINFPLNTAGINAIDALPTLDGRQFPFEGFTRYRNVPNPVPIVGQIQSDINQFIMIQFQRNSAIVNVVNPIGNPNLNIQAVGSAKTQFQTNIAQPPNLQRVNWVFKGNGEIFAYVNANKVLSGEHANISLQSLSMSCPSPDVPCDLLISNPASRLSFGIDTFNGPNNQIPADVCHDVCVEEVRFIGVPLTPPTACIAFPTIPTCRLSGATLPTLAANTHPNVFIICVDETITNNCTHITVRVGLLIIAQTTTPGLTVPFVTSLTVDFPFNAFIPFPDCTAGPLNELQFIDEIERIDGSCTLVQLNATVDTTGTFITIAGKVIEKLWKHENLWIIGLRPYDLSPNDVSMNGFVSFTVSQELQPINTCTGFPCTF